MKCAVITGHSKGLGAAITRELLARRYRVLGLSRSTLTDADPTNLQQVTLDLADETALQGWLSGAELQRFFTGVQQALLVNNAGMIAPISPIGDQDPGQIARSVSLNLTAALLLSNAFVAATATLADRRLIHISSGAARSSIHGWSVYCTTKAALDHHARCIAAEQIPNLRVSSIAPGMVDTGMQADIRHASKQEFSLVETFRGFKQAGQLASPGETARQLLCHILGDRCGEPVCVDIREL